ncbi:hypothetical protein [Brucella melitensis]|uniref:hypothetical protein n=1 Tax=Brucella melitensis TaxID=29459 RepID=UPI0011BD6879|nr:hypothetical protein [Brucella melitensis]
MGNEIKHPANFKQKMALTAKRYNALPTNEQCENLPVQACATTGYFSVVPYLLRIDEILRDIHSMTTAHNKF